MSSVQILGSSNCNGVPEGTVNMTEEESQLKIASIEETKDKNDVVSLSQHDAIFYDLFP